MIQSYIKANFKIEKEKSFYCYFSRHLCTKVSQDLQANLKGLWTVAELIGIFIIVPDMWLN